MGDYPRNPPFTPLSEMCQQYLEWELEHKGFAYLPNWILPYLNMPYAQDIEDQQQPNSSHTWYLGESLPPAWAQPDAKSPQGQQQQPPNSHSYEQPKFSPPVLPGTKFEAPQVQQQQPPGSGSSSSSSWEQPVFQQPKAQPEPKVQPQRQDQKGSNSSNNSSSSMEAPKYKGPPAANAWAKPVAPTSPPQRESQPGSSRCGNMGQDEALLEGQPKEQRHEPVNGSGNSEQSKAKAKTKLQDDVNGIEETERPVWTKAPAEAPLVTMQPQGANSCVCVMCINFFHGQPGANTAHGGGVWAGTSRRST
jgi:hypothetical protein